MSVPVDRYSAGVANKREKEKSYQSQSFLVAELRKAYCHSLMTFVRLIFIRSQQSVPPGEIETIVAVGLSDYH